MVRKLLMIVIASLFCIPAGVGSAAASVTDEVRKTVDEVVRIVSDAEMKKPKNDQKRRTAIKGAISVIFDYREMAKRSLARHWKDRNAAEQKEFTQLFASLLESSYAGKIESYHNEKIVYLKEDVQEDNAEVKSKVITPSKDEYSIDYRLMKQNGKWMVYDVVIEGVSLVGNYRSQFNKIISNEGYGALVKKLKTKNEEIAKP